MDTLAPGRLALHMAGGTLLDARRLETAFGDWRTAPPDAWRRSGLSAAVAERLTPLLRAREDEDEGRRCRELGVRLVPADGPAAPGALLHLHRPPILLAVRGRWPPSPDTLAVVGARAASAYGRHVAGSVGRLAAAGGWALVSGLARGVDRHALEACADHGGWPLAVLGTGMDVSYPRENRRLQERLAGMGTVVSEFRLGTRPDRWTFPRRNRIIAALARAVVVVEAGARSGALITAHHGLELGRDVFAVPGRIDAPLSVGTNRLVADGAQPLWDLGSFAELLAASRETPPDGRSEAAEAGDPLLDALGRSPGTADELAATLSQAVPGVRSRLMALELEGRVRRLAGGRYTLR